MTYVPFISSPPEVVRKMLEKADIRGGETVYDLGCGDGRIIITAVEEFKAKKAVGVEIREDLVKTATEEIRKKRLEPSVSVVHGDFLQVPIAEADAVTLFLTTSANERLRPKLDRELRDGVRVVSHDYEIVGWKPVKVENMGQHTIYVYVKGKR